MKIRLLLKSEEMTFNLKPNIHKNKLLKLKKSASKMLIFVRYGTEKLLKLVIAVSKMLTLIR